MSAIESSIRVRLYRPQDFAALHALDQECFAPGIAYTAEELRHFLSARDALVRVADRDGEILGFIIAQIYRGRPTFQARIITIDVAPQHRKSGIGALLMDACEQEMRRRLVTRVRLEVAVANSSAQSFYRKYRYEEIGRIPEYYPTGEDALVLQKVLQKKL
jgi:ribosomal-protein-alanine N-acetyltransferase